MTSGQRHRPSRVVKPVHLGSPVARALFAYSLLLQKLAVAQFRARRPGLARSLTEPRSGYTANHAIAIFSFLVRL